MSEPMKNSGVPWIGKIPTHWNTVPIKVLCNSIFAGGTPKSDIPEYWDGTVPWIPSGSCHDCVITRAPKFITRLGFESSSTKLIPHNTTVMAMTGATCANTGYVQFETCANQSVVAYVNKEERAYSKYLFYVLQAARSYILTYQTGGAQAGINVDECKNLVVPYVPTVEEQKEISDYLDQKCSAIDDVIDLQEREIIELSLYKRAIISKSITKGLNPSALMKNSGIEWVGNIPGHWDVRRLKSIGNTQNGISQNGDYFGEGFPFVSYTDVYKNYSLPKMVEGLAKSNSCEQEVFSVEEGDVFFTRTSETIEEIGFSSVCLETIPKAVFAGFLIRFRPKKDTLDPVFAKYYFRSDIHRAFFVKEMTIVTRASLSQELLKSMPVLLPPIAEQKEIGEYLDAQCATIDALMQAKRAKIDSLKEYRKSLIYEYATGKKRL